MRVLFVTGIYPPDIGGPATYVSALAATLGDRGHDVAVVTLSDTNPGLSRQGAVRLRRLPRSRDPLARFLALVSTVRHEARASDLVYVNGLYLESAVACRGLRCRRVAKVVGDWAWERAAVRGWFPPDIEAFQSAHVAGRCRLLRSLHRRALRGMDRVIVPSAYLAGLAEGWGIESSRIVVIPNALAPSERPPAAPSLPRSSRRVVAVGRLVPWKHFDLLVEAVASVPGCELEIVGAGPEEGRLRRLAAERGLSGRVDFRGGVSREETLRRLASAAAIALPSSYEGWPHVLVEAMAVGTPVVAAAAGGTPELVRDGENGLLVPVGDAASLSGAIRRVLDDPAFARTLSEGGRRTVEGWTWDGLVERTVPVLEGTDRLAVLMIGTTESLLDAEIADETVRRLVAYGDRIDRLHALVCTGRAGAEARVRGGSVTATPVAGRSRVGRYVRAARRGAGIVGREAITIVQAQEPVFAGPAAWWLSRRAGVGLVTVAYGVDPWDPGYLATGAAERIAAPWARAVLRASDHVLVDTEAAKAGMVERGIPGDRVTVKPMVPSDLASFRDIGRDEGRRRLGLDAGPWLLWVGRGSRQKNLPLLADLVRATKREMPDVRWMVIGPPRRDRWPSTVRWMGRIDRPTMAAAVAACDAVVVTSFYEGFARVYMEAGWAGRPVLTTPTAGACDVVRDGVSGVVYARDDVGGFVERLRDVVEGGGGEDLGRELGRRVRARLAAIDDIDLQTRVWRTVLGEGVRRSASLRPPLRRSGG